MRVYLSTNLYTNSLRLVIYSLRNTERVPFGTTQKRRSLRKGLENIKAHLKLSFVRDKHIPLKREYIKSFTCNMHKAFLK
jgi:hypothetical protein